MIESAWASLINFWPYGECTLLIFLGMSVTLVFFWIHNLLLYVFCYHKDYFSQYKNQQGKHPSSDLVKECLISNVIGFVIGNPILNYLLYSYCGDSFSLFDSNKIPSFTKTSGYIVLYHIAFDTYFYWAHRLFHHPRLYKYHKKHHRFYVPIGICATFAHPLEDFVVNLGSVVIGPILFPSHVYVWLLFLAFRLHETVDVHSGYDFPWSPWHRLTFLHGGSRRHDFHHSNPIGDYGGFVFWDWIMGTNEYTKMVNIAKSTKKSK